MFEQIPLYKDLHKPMNNKYNIKTIHKYLI